MARQVLGGLTTLNLATNLDPMFLELYQLRDLFTISGSLLGFGISPAAKFDVSGNGRFSGSNTAAVISGITSVSLGVAGSAPHIAFANLAGGADAKIWDQQANTTQYEFRLLSDTALAATNWLAVTRSGMTPSAASFNCVVRPVTDNAVTLGGASNRWSVVYAGTGSINTSDAREKTKVASLTERELAAAKQLSKEIGAFKFLTSVDAKGDDARIHIGMTVQRAIEVMLEHDLDPFAYAFICYDEWEAEDHPAQYVTEERNTGFFDTSGKAITETITTEVKPAYTTPAGNRYGFRVDQLNLFIASGLAARLDDLEAGSATA